MDGGSGDSVDWTTDDYKATDSDKGGNEDSQEWLYGGIGILLGAVVTLLVIAIAVFCHRRNLSHKGNFADVENGKPRSKYSVQDHAENSRVILVHQSADSDDGSAAKLSTFETVNGRITDNNTGHHAKSNEGYSSSDDDEASNGSKYSVSDIDRVDKDVELAEDEDSASAKTDSESDTFPDPPADVVDDAEEIGDDVKTTAGNNSQISVANESTTELDRRIIPTDIPDDGMPTLQVRSADVHLIDSSSEDETESGLNGDVEHEIETNYTIDSGETEEATDAFASSNAIIVPDNQLGLSDTDEVSISDDDEESDNGEYKLDD